MVTKARNIWTTKQEARLRELCGTMPLEEVAEEMGISYHAAKNKAYKLKIPTAFEREEFYAFFKGDRHLITGTAKECAALLGVKVSTVYCYITPAQQERFARNSNPNNVIVGYRI